MTTLTIGLTEALLGRVLDGLGQPGRERAGIERQFAQEVDVHGVVRALAAAMAESARSVEDVRFNPCFPTILGVTRADGSAQIFDMRCLSGPLLQIPDGVDAMATRLTFLPCTSDLLAVGSSNSVVRIWCLRTGSPSAASCREEDVSVTSTTNAKVSNSNTRSGLPLRAHPTGKNDSKGSGPS